ncbi:hypothetical protein [Legionella rowbothamii]|uniref:hypothetical protein n=1 Tax=Legionella rowbothamii TaxID=96229 RepID=UPI0010561BD1|nr:hypothetical protein [Legionella rowbothamii]
MPTITLNTDGRAVSPENFATGTYRSTTIALTEGGRGGTSIEVPVQGSRVLSATDGGCLWSNSFQSCFPVIFKYTNGDIGLYHANHGAIDNVMALLDLLNKPGIQEIQLFSKPRTDSQNKVGMLSKNLSKHFLGKEGAPIINVADDFNYGVAACYKTADRQPIILVGESGAGNEMAVNKEGCTNQDDVTIPCRFQLASIRHPLSTASTPTASSSSSSHIEAQRQIRTELIEFKDQSKKLPEPDGEPSPSAKKSY